MDSTICKVLDQFTVAGCPGYLGCTLTTLEEVINLR